MFGVRKYEFEDVSAAIYFYVTLQRIGQGFPLVTGG